MGARGPSVIPMEQSTLAEVLGVEKETRDKLDAEREQAGKWLENARREIEQAHLAELARLRESVAQGEEAARQAARDKAAEIVRQAEIAARQADRFQDDELRQLILRHISVLTGRRDAP